MLKYYHYTLSLIYSLLTHLIYPKIITAQTKTHKK